LGLNIMRRKLGRFLALAFVSGAWLAQANGCMIDPDIPFRAALTFGSDTTIFLLDNLLASL